MLIFIMRHGEAVPIQQDDRERQLTPMGWQQSESSGKWLAACCEEFQISLDYALVSPYVRAQQTFEAVSKQIDIKQRVTNTDIVPSGDPAIAHAYLDYLLQEHAHLRGVLLVSHMPFVSYLLDHMSIQPYSMLFSTGAVVALKYDLVTSKASMVGQFLPD